MTRSAAPRIESTDFAAWSEERDQISEELRETPEADETQRDRRLGGSHELERRRDAQGQTKA